MPFRLIQPKVEEILSLDGSVVQLEKSLKKSLYDLKHLNTIRLGKREIKSKVSILIDELEKYSNKDTLETQLNWFKLLHSKIDEYIIFWNACSELYLEDLAEKLKVILDEHGIEIGVKHRGVNFMHDQSVFYLGNRFCFYIRNNHSSIFYYLRQMIESMEEHEKKEYLVDIIDELKVLEQKLIEAKDTDRNKQLK